MSVLAYEQFTLPWAPELHLAGTVRSMIERVPSDPRIAGHLERYKQLAREGWNVAALLADDSKTVVLIAYRECV